LRQLRLYLLTALTNLLRNVLDLDHRVRFDDAEEILLE
jgi:hypothetical protein